MKCMFLFSINCIILGALQAGQDGLYINKQEEVEWFNAVKKGDLYTIKRLTCFIDVNHKNSRGQTALHQAARWDQQEVVHYLVQSKHIDLNARTITGQTALHIAVNKGHDKIVILLLNVPGIDIDAQDTAGFTPLDRASKLNRKYIELIIQKKLIELKSQVFESLHQQDYDKFKLLTKQVDMNIKNDEGDTPLHLVLKSKRFDLALSILQNSHIDTRKLFALANGAGRTPLELIDPTSEFFKFSVDLAFTNKKERPSTPKLEQDIEINSEINSSKKNCGNCGTDSCEKRCGKCKLIYYCSLKCQRQHWKIHKAECE